MISLEEGAKRLVTICANLQPDEVAIVLTDDNKLEIAKAVHNYIRDELHGISILLVMPVQDVGGAEPPAAVAEALKYADVIFGLTTYSISQTKARTDANKAGARMLNIPNVELSDLTERLIQADFVAVSPSVMKVAEALEKGCHFHVTAPGGTDFTFDGTGRKGRGLDGRAHDKGIFRSMSVEANMGPLEGTAEGMFVIDGSVPDIGPLDEPIRCTLKGGRIVKIEGGEKAKAFDERLGSIEDLMYCVGEFGIGMNPCAILTGSSYLEDESAISTCHIGFGSNISQGGTIKAKGHIDAVIKSPTIEIDGEILMKDGEFLTVPLKPQQAM